MRKLLLLLCLLAAVPAQALDLVDRVQIPERRYEPERGAVYASRLIPRGGLLPMFQIIPGAGGGGGASGITIGSTAITGGATTQVLYNLAGVVTSDAGFTRSGLNGTTTIDNGSGAVSSLVVSDNGTPVVTVADGGVTTFAQGLTVSASKSLLVGVNGLYEDPGQTPDTTFLYVGTSSKAWHIAEAADVGAADFNNGRCLTAACTNPSLIIHSPDQVTTEYLQLQTDATGAAHVQSNLAEITVGGSKLNITEASAQVIARITLPTNGVYGALVTYSVFDSDGTDFVVRNGSIQIQGGNKAGTSTCTILSTRDQETEDGSSVATSAAFTLTYTWTNVVNTTSCDLSLNAASSAGVNTYDITYTVMLTGSSNAVTVNPQ